MFTPPCIRQEAIITQLLSQTVPDLHPDLVAAEALAQATKIADDCAAIADQIDRIGAYPSQEFEWIAKSGLLAVPLGKAWGGMAEAGSLPLLQLLKHLGRGNLSVGRIYEGHINALQLIQTFGSEDQITRYASDASDHQRLFAVWNTEAADGVQILPLGNGRYQLQGAKTFASGAGQVKRPLITGRLPDGGWQMMIVPMEQIQVEIDPTWWQPSGMRASASYRINFSGVELTTEDLIGRPNDYRRQPWFSGGAIRFAAVQLGGAEALLNATRAHLQTLKRTEDPYQQARLGEMAIAVESGSLWLRGAAMIADDWLTASEDAPQLQEQANQIVAHANMTRSAIEQICLQVIQLAERSVGARGLLPPNPIERIIRDLTLYLRQPAPDAALANVGAYVLNSTAPVHTLWDANGCG